MCSLGEVCSGIEYGYTAKSNRSGEGARMLRITDIQNNKVNWGQVPFCEITERDKQKYALEKWDLVFARTGATVGKSFLIRDDVDNTVFASYLIRVRCLIKPMASYLSHYFGSKAYWSQITEFSAGIGQPNVNGSKLKNLKVPIAPLAEQKRIADKLDTVLARVDACRDRLDRVPLILRRFRQSVLAAATSGKLTAEWRASHGLPFSWADVRLSDIADVKGGITKDSKKQSSLDEEVPYLRVANVQRGYLDLNEIKAIRVPSVKLKESLLEEGDILFNEGGDIDKLGRGWIWEGQIDRCTFQNHVFRARLKDKRNQPKYVSWWGNYCGLEYFLRAGKQTTNLASINKTVLSNLPIQLPSPQEQEEIVRRVETLFGFADRLESRLTTARNTVDRLTPSLLAKAFRGELVVQDPNDEPAIELLKRLAADRETAPKSTRMKKAA